jgi:hypothetical protein
MSSEHLLSTTDNPYNPWTQWDQWLAWDTQEGYHSLALLGRTVRDTGGESDQVDDQAGEDAIDTIVTENFSGFHIKVAKPSEPQSSEE